MESLSFDVIEEIGKMCVNEQTIDVLFGWCWCLFYAALPPPTVDIVVNGTNILGQALSLTCVVGVVDRLIIQPVIVWEKFSSNELLSVNNIRVGPSRNGNNSTLSFPSLHTSDAGLYTCTATITIGSIDILFTEQDTQNITLQSKIVSPLLLSTTLFDARNLIATFWVFEIRVCFDDNFNT